VEAIKNDTKCLLDMQGGCQNSAFYSGLKYIVDGCEGVVSSAAVTATTAGVLAFLMMF
jgi:hypothetical protein